MKALLVLLLASPALAQTSVRVSEVSLVPAISGAAGTIGGAALPLPVLGAGALSPLSPSLSIARTPALAVPAAVAAQAAASALPIPVLPAAPVPVQAAERAAESFRPQATAMRALAVAAPVKTGDEARLDGLFEGSASRAGSGVAAPAGTTALAPLIKALPAFSPA